MDKNVKLLLQSVCSADIRTAQNHARAVLESLGSEKDRVFKAESLRLLDAQKSPFTELPPSVKSLISVEDVSVFPNERFLLRATEKRATDETLKTYRASKRLSDIGIPYLPALLLHGSSGCGKTTLVRYIAHKAELPFCCVRFSNLVCSHLGETQSNIAKIFDFIRSHPCVLCFDELDAIGLKRGQMQDVGEMNRIVIAIMQELDTVPKNVIIVGTTNRFADIDPALARRFPIQYELSPFTFEDAKGLAHKFLTSVDIAAAPWTASPYWIDTWGSFALWEGIPASQVIKKCTDLIVDQIILQLDKEATSENS